MFCDYKLMIHVCIDVRNPLYGVTAWQLNERDKPSVTFSKRGTVLDQVLQGETNSRKAVFPRINRPGPAMCSYPSNAYDIQA